MDLTKGVSGRLGALTGHSLVKHLAALKCDGTLLLYGPRGVQLLLIVAGQVKARHTLQGRPNLNEPDQRFRFQASAASEVPELSSRYPTSSVGVCRALPDIEGTLSAPSSLVDLRSLLQHLSSREFSGCVTAVAAQGRGVIVLKGGDPGTAHYESSAQVRTDHDALRATLRLCAKPDTEITASPLPEPIASALIGLGLELAPAADEPLTGVEVDGAGYTFLVAGRPYLRIPVDVGDAKGRYASCGEPVALRLPDEPAGWESRRYALTLRGRDALNPMTQLAMDFRRTYGKTGTTILSEVANKRSIEEIARNLRLELAELGSWLEKLANDGMIHSVDDPQPAKIAKEPEAYRNEAR